MPNIWTPRGHDVAHSTRHDQQSIAGRHAVQRGQRVVEHLERAEPRRSVVGCDAHVNPRSVVQSNLGRQILACRSLP